MKNDFIKKIKISKEWYNSDHKIIHFKYNRYCIYSWNVLNHVNDITRPTAYYHHEASFENISKYKFNVINNHMKNDEKNSIFLIQEMNKQLLYEFIYSNEYNIYHDMFLDTKEKNENRESMDPFVYLKKKQFDNITKRRHFLIHDIYSKKNTFAMYISLKNGLAIIYPETKEIKKEASYFDIQNILYRSTLLISIKDENKNKFYISNLHLHNQLDNINELLQFIQILKNEYDFKKLFCIGDFNRNMNHPLYRQKLDTISVGVMQNDSITFQLDTQSTNKFYSIDNYHQHEDNNYQKVDHVLYTSCFFEKDSYLFRKDSTFTRYNNLDIDQHIYRIPVETIYYNKQNYKNYEIINLDKLDSRNGNSIFDIFEPNEASQEKNSKYIFLIDPINKDIITFYKATKHNTTKNKSCKLLFFSNCDQNIETILQIETINILKKEKKIYYFEMNKKGKHSIDTDNFNDKCLIAYDKTNKVYSII